MEKYKIISLIFFVIGTCFLITAIYLYSKFLSFKKYGIRTKGTVKEVEKRLSQNLSGANEIKYTYYLYTVEYNTEEGRYSVKLQDGIKRKYNVGEILDIVYNRKKVNNFFIVGENVNKKLYLLFIFLGVFLVIGSILFYFK